ncbi:MAG: hypothetical protein M3N98_03645, partial [Actinomycetota bacterium]|nr:hypothetical protein [Actinomycetota bacterium]
MALAVAVVLTVAACSGTASSRAAPTSSLAETVPSPPATDPVTTTSSTVPVTVSTSSATAVPATTAAPPETTLPAAKAHPLGTYTDWQWALIPPGAWYTDQELNLSVVTDPGPGTPFFFAHMVGFVHGLGGYIGLQT